MRLGLPLMLAVSLAFHGGLVLGIFAHHSHATAASVATTSRSDSSSLILLGSENIPDMQTAASTPVWRESALGAAQARPVPAVPPPIAPVEKKPAPAMPAPSLALAAHSASTLRSLPPEAILSPAFAPHLNGRDGIVFILDVSGSMYEPCNGSTRLNFARQTLANRIHALKDGTPFAITIYAEHSRNSGPLVAASDLTRDAALRFIQRNFDCGGGTNLPDGLACAELLGSGRLVIISDGDLNMKLPELLTKAGAILGPEGHCPALMLVGIYPRPHTDNAELLQSLADRQGGTYHTERFDSDPELLTSNRPLSDTR